MKRSEFEPFVEHLMGAMPSYASWLEKMPSASAESSIPSQRGVLDAFYRVVERVSLADACKAIDAIHAGDEPEPRVYDHLPRSVRQIAFKLRRARGAYQQTRFQNSEKPACGWCDGGGIVYVLTPLCQYVLRQAWGKKLPANWQAWYLESDEAANWRQSLECAGKSIEATRPCCCELGRPCDDSERFDPAKDCPYHAVELDEVVAWFAEGPVDVEELARRRREGRQRVAVPGFLWQPEAA